MPFKVRQRIIQQLIRSYAGPPERYGLPKPDHRFGEAHPTVSGRILDRIQHGTITPKPNIEALEGARVRFVDGSAVEADVVVYCTGYKITFPFFDEDLISAPENHIELFRRVFHPDIPNVFFIGLLQPLGAIMPLAEAQGAWVGDYLLGDYALPERAELRADIAADQAAMRARYVASKRHTIQVDFDDYLHALAKERRAGARAGARKRLRPPVTMPTFCRHNRFIERCPICSKTLPGCASRRGGATPARPRAGARRARRTPATARRCAARCAAASAARAPRGARRARTATASELCPGFRPRPDAERLAEEIAFASGRLLAARARAPRGSTARLRELAGERPRAGHLELLPDRLPVARCRTEDPFAGIRAALARSGPAPAASCRTLDRLRQLGPRRLARPCSAGRPDAAAPTASGLPAERSVPRRRPSGATLAGRPSGASSACSSGSRCRASGARAAMNCS